MTFAQPGTLSIRGSASEGPTSTGPDVEREPSPAELAEIEAEMPEIEAGMALVDAQARMARAKGAPSSLDWRALRRAERQVLAARDLIGRRRSAEFGPEAA